MIDKNYLAYTLCKQDSCIIGDNQGCKRCKTIDDCSKYKIYVERFVNKIMKAKENVT